VNKCPRPPLSLGNLFVAGPKGRQRLATSVSWWGPERPFPPGQPVGHARRGVPARTVNPVAGLKFSVFQQNHPAHPRHPSILFPSPPCLRVFVFQPITHTLPTPTVLSPLSPCPCVAVPPGGRRSCGAAPSPRTPARNKWFLSPFIPRKRVITCQASAIEETHSPRHRRGPVSCPRAFVSSSCSSPNPPTYVVSPRGFRPDR
jgi:hypothetical protein